MTETIGTEIDDKLERPEGIALTWPIQCLARHPLNLSDYFAVLPDRRTQRSTTWCNRAIPRRWSHQQVRKKSYHQDWLMRSSGNLGWFLIIISMFLLLVFSLEFIPTFLFFWKSSDGNTLPLTVPTAFSVITQASLTICQKELVSSCYVPPSGVHVLPDSRHMNSLN